MSQQPPGFNVPGAIDLGALAQARQIQEEAAKARTDLIARADASGPAGPVVFDVTDETFQAEVLDRSMTVPVVIDFWAEWCAPCKQLSPVLESLAQDDGGAWVLAKVDVDASPQLSAAAQVQSIPTVLVVWQGQVIPGFTGALPPEQVRLFLDEVLALVARAPGAPEPTAAADPELVTAEELMMAGDLPGAASAYREFLAQRPGHPEATAGLARVELLLRTQGVDATAVRAAADADPADVAAVTASADLDVLDGEIERAFGRLVAAVRVTGGDERTQLRDRLVALFAMVGDDDARVLAARRDLASALF
jgi:putative thioredoxin